MKATYALIALAGLNRSLQHQRPPVRPGIEQPAMGFGTWGLNVSFENTTQAVARAIEVGYRQIDCSPSYGNERAVGEGIALGLKAAGLSREDIWVTSKLSSDDHESDSDESTKGHVEAALDQTLFDLGLEYLDLYLLEWPWGRSIKQSESESELMDPRPYFDDDEIHSLVDVDNGTAAAKPQNNKYPNNNDDYDAEGGDHKSRYDQHVDEYEYRSDYAGTWQAMIRLLSTNKTRYIGVSNFNKKWLKELLDTGSSKLVQLKPFVHQMEHHPYLQQRAWLSFHEKLGIKVTAYSPLGNMNPLYDGTHSDVSALLDNYFINSIAERSNCTPAQVVLVWGMSKTASVITKSKQEQHIIENYGSLNCHLNKWELNGIDNLGEGPYRFNVPLETWESGGFDPFPGLEDDPEGDSPLSSDESDFWKE